MVLELAVLAVVATVSLEAEMAVVLVAATTANLVTLTIAEPVMVALLQLL